MVKDGSAPLRSNDLQEGLEWPALAEKIENPGTQISGLIRPSGTVGPVDEKAAMFSAPIHNYFNHYELSRVLEHVRTISLGSEVAELSWHNIEIEEEIEWLMCGSDGEAVLGCGRRVD